MPRLLTLDERKILTIALTCRENIIETGDYSLSATDAENCGKGIHIKALTTEQMKLIIASKELKAKIQGDKLEIYTKN